MKTRAASATAGGTTPTTGGQSNRSGGARARDKIRDKTNNQPEAILRSTSATASHPFKQPKRPKPKSKSKRKQAAANAGKPATASDSSLHRHAAECTAYLHRWEQNRSEWRFEKLKQIWLLKHALHRELIPDEYFEVLLNYLTLLKGAAKYETLREMRDHMQSYEQRYLGVVKRVGVGDPTAEEECKYERARQIVQMLSEEDEGDGDGDF